MEPLRTLNESRQYLNDFFRNHSSECPLIVCGNSWKKMPLNEELVRLAGSSRIKLSYFSDFEPNPQYRSVIKGVNTFQKFHCDCIIAAGGGSAIDVAKCIKLSKSISRVLASKLEVGSSNKITEGFARNKRAKAKRCN